MTTTTINQRLQELSEGLEADKALLAQVKSIEIPLSSLATDTPPTSPHIPWAWLLAGLGLGLAGGVALALTLTGALG